MVNVRSASEHPLTSLSHKILKVYIYRTTAQYNDTCVISLRSSTIKVKIPPINLTLSQMKGLTNIFLTIFTGSRGS